MAVRSVKPAPDVCAISSEDTMVVALTTEGVVRLLIGGGAGIGRGDHREHHGQPGHDRGDQFGAEALGISENIAVKHQVAHQHDPRARHAEAPADGALLRVRGGLVTRIAGCGAAGYGLLRVPLTRRRPPGDRGGVRGDCGAGERAAGHQERAVGRCRACLHQFLDGDAGAHHHLDFAEGGQDFSTLLVHVDLDEVQMVEASPLDGARKVLHARAAPAHNPDRSPRRKLHQPLQALQRRLGQ